NPLCAAKPDVSLSIEQLPRIAESLRIGNILLYDLESTASRGQAQQRSLPTHQTLPSRSTATSLAFLRATFHSVPLCSQRECSNPPSPLPSPAAHTIPSSSWVINRIVPLLVANSPP